MKVGIKVKEREDGALSFQHFDVPYMYSYVVNEDGTTYSATYCGGERLNTEDLSSLIVGVISDYHLGYSRAQAEERGLV